MKSLSCHLIDLTCIPNMKISLSSGYLESFANSDTFIKNRVQFRKHCYYIGRDLESIVSDFFRSLEFHGEVPDIVGFTIYFWNNKLSQLMAQRIKTRFPSTLIIFGGNDVTNQGETLLENESSVDAICNGEGERVFRNFLLQNLQSVPNLNDVNGLTFRSKNGHIITNCSEDRIADLGEIPSPFLTGVFSQDDIKSSQIIVYEFSRGCPFKCSFCYWGAAINTRVRRFPMEVIEKDLLFIFEHMRENSTLFLADANFGMVKSDIEIARLLTKILNGYRKSIFMFANWAKNTSQCVVETAKILFDGRLISSVTLSAQSLNDQVLQYAQRKNIPFEYYKKLQFEFRELGIPTYTELLLGMPGESYDSFMKGVENILQSGGHPVIYPLLLLNNTEYARPEIREQFAIKSQLMPYQMFNEHAQVEIVTSHSELSYAEWLRALSISLIMTVFNHGILKFVILKIHDQYNISYIELFECIYDCLMNDSLLHAAKVNQIFRNYIESWKDFRQFDAKLIQNIMGSEFIEDNVHYQAILKVILADDFPIDDFIEELSKKIVKKLVSSDAEKSSLLSSWIKTQQLIVQALAYIVKYTFSSENPTGSNNICSFEIFLPFKASNISAELSVRTEFFGSRFDTFVLGIYHGSVDTLRLFERQSKVFDLQDYRYEEI